VIANPVLELKGLFARYFIALFTTAFCANMIGLNISASFNSAITIYIVIPLIIIPMMVLSGAMFPFDKLNRKIGSVDKVPVIAELMPTRWTYEALMVTQFKDNRYNRYSDSQYGKTVYEYKKDQSVANYYINKLLPALNVDLEKTDSLLRISDSGGETGVESPKLNKSKNDNKLKLITNELKNLTQRFPTLQPFRYMSDLTPDRYNASVYNDLKKYLVFVGNNFNRIESKVTGEWDDFYLSNRAEIRRLENLHSNLKLQEIVTKFYEREKNKILEYKDNYVQNYDPIYLDPVKNGFLSFRTHFFAPSKYVFGRMIDTFVFNITLVLLSTAVLFIILYFDLLLKLVRFIENLRIIK
jgi:hypothetical protein